MPALDIRKELNEDTRGAQQHSFVRLVGTDRLISVLGQDPLIPPALLQAEVPAVGHSTVLLSRH